MHPNCYYQQLLQELCKEKRSTLTPARQGMVCAGKATTLAFMSVVVLVIVIRGGQKKKHRLVRGWCMLPVNSFLFLL